MDFRQRIIITMVALGLMLTGCALSPQQLMPIPIVSVKSLPQTGHGQEINLQVFDGRASTILGTRGGLYASSSYITVSSEAVLSNLKKRTVIALEAMGYKVVNNVSEAPVLVVTLAELTYKTPSTYFVRSAEVTAVLHSQLKTFGNNYNGRYNAILSRDFMTTPEIDDNTQLVSDALATAITRMLNDTGITGLLNQ